MARGSSSGWCRAIRSIRTHCGPCAIGATLTASHSSSPSPGRIAVWEKHEIARLTPPQLHSNLNILMLKLASTNRETQEQLKFFRDSGGNIVLHFPPENEPEQHKALKSTIRNLDMLAEDEARG